VAQAIAKDWLKTLRNGGSTISDIVALQKRYMHSLTDHNTINKTAYVSIIKLTRNILVGSELHIRYAPTTPPYHCHIFFNIDLLNNFDTEIDRINHILDTLYPKKEITPETAYVPTIQEIINIFDNDDFVLLPHGGQSHKTFDTAIPDDTVFDTTLERSIYYNQFDGFTARGDKGLERTKRYFDRLGISSFVNLVTGSDNYNPKNYPEPKDPDASPYIPTWMHALPNLDGLRISLSEESRFTYSENCPDSWSEHIKKVHLANDKIDIDVELTPGLNVVIGGSSSGKTLFVDTLSRKINGSLPESVYTDFLVDQIQIDNPSGKHPHYIPQNYITQIITDAKKTRSISEIEVIKRVFQGDAGLDNRIEIRLRRLNDDLQKLMQSVETIETCLEKYKHMAVISRLFVESDDLVNIIGLLMPSDELSDTINYSVEQHSEDIERISQIALFLRNNPFVDSMDVQIHELLSSLDLARKYSSFEEKIKNIVSTKKDELNAYYTQNNIEQQTKRTQYDMLLATTKLYVKALTEYHRALTSITEYSFSCKSQTIESAGHHLVITNNFSLTKSKVIEVMNSYLKTVSKIDMDDDIVPSMLFKHNFKERPFVSGYNDFRAKIYSDFSKMNVKSYKITTSDGLDFDKLSAGWKTSVLLDLVLGYEGDNATLIIDQPEDNLANGYINNGLIKAIKKAKKHKQIIMVSHNATIPMLGDAQNVILCRNDGKIIIRAARLEAHIDNKSMVDYIAEIADGGKPSIKKRVKKYNLKKYK